jgi:predicted PurR-regulated permease PerM
MERKRILYLISLAAVSIILLYFLYPLLDGIVLGIVFAYIAYPVKIRLCRRMGGRSASLLATLLIILPITAIILLGIFEMASQAASLFQGSTYVTERFNVLLSSLSPQLGDLLSTVFEWFESFFYASLSNLPVREYATEIAMLVLNGFIAVISCYYYIADGKKLAGAIRGRASDRTYSLLEKSSKKISDVFVGNFYSAIVISLISLPFFLYFSIPFWAIATGFMFIAAMIPIFAEWMVIVPVSFYVLLVQGWTPFLVFLLVGLIFIYLIPEFILRPQLVGRYSSSHPLLLLLAFIGGGLTFGISGFFLAPMLICVALVLWENPEG